MGLKIKENDRWPFFTAYRDAAYIMRHDASRTTVLREPKEKREFRLLNESGKEFVVYRVDGGIITQDVPKCDYAIYVDDDTLFLIELKGADLNRAIEQIDSAIDLLVKVPRVKVTKLNARIVVSKVSVPAVVASKERRLQQRLHGIYGGGDYKKQSRQMEERI